MAVQREVRESGTLVLPQNSDLVQTDLEGNPPLPAPCPFPVPVQSVRWRIRIRIANGGIRGERAGTEASGRSAAAVKVAQTSAPHLLRPRTTTTSMMAACETHRYVGVDVGTGSVRACVIDGNGTLLASAASPIRTWHPQPSFYHQSTRDIWQSTVQVVREVMERSHTSADEVMGIGFDATCSMAVLDAEKEAVAVRQGDPDDQNVVLWMDHRAVKMAHHIARTYPSILPSLGGTFDPEHPLPKLAWLHANLPPAHWARIKHAVELPEWMCWRATEGEERSGCSFFASSVCEREPGPVPEQEQALGSTNPTTTRYVHTPPLWHATNLKPLGPDTAYSLLGGQHPAVLPPGHPVPGGFSARAAKEMGLNAGTPVGMALVDAHAGWAGCVAVGVGAGGDDSTVTALRSRLERRMVSTCGTSACHYVATTRAVDVPGVWGPYEGRLGDQGWWVTEGGQGAVGAAIDHVIGTHSAYASVSSEAADRGLSVPNYLNTLLPTLASPSTPDDPSPSPSPSFHYLTRHLHVLPDFHGARSPHPHTHALGTVSGIPLHAPTSTHHLATLYLATLQALAYGIAEVVEAMEAGRGRDGGGGLEVEEIVMGGGLAGNDVWVQTVADVTGRPVIIPPNPTSTSLLGAALLGAHAHFVTESSSSDPGVNAKSTIGASNPPPIPLTTTILRLTATQAPDHVVHPTRDTALREFHERKRKVYADMREQALKWRKWMEEV
ncbi:Pentulose kinase [Gonapodya prolifera JEL478]|uniref:Pentulose kinase n=1 Tax=Gonapodya prolifera (strain JEL478) TaxID=1344416 RepID=A0A139A5G0_GONPJ|nr:Pentulose kinase [Gonapodya prolifera JEL478]|eukprot:KXS11705.1 Pentulose kinase [Gonapodya prolifera JEL478]